MTGPSHREPLDEHERELARVLRALPAGEPPAALDQRILRAAADAAAAPRRTRRWLAFGGTGWGIGGAAAAVLALGVSWHLIDPTRYAPFERGSAPTVATESDDAVTVTLAEPGAGETDAHATAPVAAQDVAPPVAVQKRSPARPAPARARSAQPAPVAAAAPAPVVPPPAPPAPPPEPFADLSGTASDATGTYAPEPAAGHAEAQGAAQAQAERAETARETRETAASAALQAQAQARPANDAAKAQASVTTAETWLAQIRELRDAQRPSEAAESLRRFRQVYPQYSIPADLLPLLRE